MCTLVWLCPATRQRSLSRVLIKLLHGCLPGEGTLFCTHVSAWRCKQQYLEPDGGSEGLCVCGASTQHECVMASKDQDGLVRK